MIRRRAAAARVAGRARAAWLAGLLALAVPAAPATTEYPAQRPQGGWLTLYSTTDIQVFDPVVRDFRQLRPDLAVRYVQLEAAPLYERYLRETAGGHPQADLLLSSSMDLQVKLVNDGYAAPHASENSRLLPSWARWRDEAFGFTFEPAVMVFNRDLMAGRAPPNSRAELLDGLKREPEFWRERIGTYDIAASSVGYLLASQDARQSSEFGALVEALQDVQARTFERAGDLLNQLERGELVAGYNVLGSYARARAEAGAPLVIVYPQDYTLAVSRTVVLPKNAPNPQAAHAFLEYLLSLRGQRALATRSHLSAVRAEIGDPYGRLGLSETRVGPLRPIALGPGLLVYLDRQKRQRLLDSWRGLMEQAPP